MDELRLTFHRATAGQPLPLPLSDESVQAGFPSPASDYFAADLDLNDLLIRHKEATFYVRIAGDSMTDAGILDGDLAIVDKAATASDGDFVIACINGEFTIKQFRLAPGGEKGRLVAWNNRYPSIEVCAYDDFRIWGVVTHVIHPLKKRKPNERG